LFNKKGLITRIPKVLVSLPANELKHVRENHSGKPEDFGLKTAPIN